MAFWKKNCKKCGKKIEKKYTYCPYCGSNLLDIMEESKNYGFLGRDDDFDFFKEETKLPFGMNFIFKNLIKEMDKQFQELDRQIGQEARQKEIKHREQKPKRQIGENQNPFLKQGGISINISSSSDSGIPVIKIKGFGNIPEFKEIENNLIQEKRENKQKKIMPVISEEKAKEFAKLPRQEAESKVRRLSGRVIYEIELPGVKNLKDIVINKLENSIEIKAFSKDKAYFKLLPFSLPLIRYRLLKEKLILELGEK